MLTLSRLYAVICKSACLRLRSLTLSMMVISLFAMQNLLLR